MLLSIPKLPEITLRLTLVYTTDLSLQDFISTPQFSTPVTQQLIDLEKKEENWAVTCPVSEQTGTCANVNRAFSVFFFFLICFEWEHPGATNIVTFPSRGEVTHDFSGNTLDIDSFIFSG